jgi:hypothetical protein
MIVLPSVNAGITSSYGIQKKFNYSYGASFNFGYNLNYYINYDPDLAYLYSDVYLYYLKVDDKVIINNNTSNYIFAQDEFLANSYFRNDGYGLGPVGCIDELNSYLKNIYKINDFTFYPAGFGDPYNPGIYLKNSIGRKMILTIYSYVYMGDDGTIVYDDYIPWTIYINYPYSETNKTPTTLEVTDFFNPNFNGYISSVEVGYAFYWN